jgi:hypothetical protein
MHSAIVPVALAFCALAVAPPAAARAGGFDGNWTVRVITEHGKCDRTASCNVEVIHGKVRYTSYSSVMLWSTVSPNGAVRVSIKHFDDGANGSGQLMQRTGGGGWSGIGKHGPCSGRWVAHRR